MFLTETQIRLMRYSSAGYLRAGNPAGTVWLDLPGGAPLRDRSEAIQELIGRKLVELDRDKTVQLTQRGTKAMSEMGFVCVACASGDHSVCAGATKCDCQHRGRLAA